MTPPAPTPTSADVREQDAVCYRIAAAQDAHARGWQVTPLAGKRPVLKDWTGQPRASREQVEAWARAGNVGALTGPASGIFVVDVDPGGQLPRKITRTPTVITGRGGRHYYFKAPSPCPGNSAGRVAAHVDTRGVGGQVVLPGSIHETGAVYRWADGLSPAGLELAEVPAWLLELVTKPPARQAAATPPATTTGNGSTAAYARAALEGELAQVHGAPRGTRNATLNSAAFNLGQLVAGGVLSEGDVEAGLLSAAASCGLIDDDGEASAFATIRSGLTAGKASPRQPAPKAPCSRKQEARPAELPALAAAAAPPATPGEEPESGDDTRPRIVVTAEAADVVDAAEDALAALPEPPVYQRGGLLVRLIRHGGPGAQDKIRRELGTPVIGLVTADHLLEVMSATALWLRKGANEEKQILPPVWAVRALLARGTWSVPWLSGVTESPVMRPDGTVHQAPGYDEETGVMFEPERGVDFPLVPERPSDAQVGAALDALKEVIVDFPFASGSDRSAVLAAILTIAARDAIDGPVPLTAYDAPTPGSGKSLLADVAAVIATGREPARLAAPTGRDGPEEWRKLLLSIAVEGSRVVLIDNIERELGSAALSMALTSMSVTGRVLGRSAMATVPLRAVFAATGNNLLFRGDLHRRVVCSRIDAGVEHPEERRDFRHPELLVWVREHRPRLMVAGLTLLRAYFAAGRPLHDRPPFGGFESWDRVVRATLLWAGEPDPLAETRIRLRAETDTDMEKLAQFLNAWRAVFRDRAVTAAAAVRTVKEAGPIWEAPADIRALSDAMAEMIGCKPADIAAGGLGYRLRKHADRPASGLRFERAGEDGHSKVMRWVVAEVRPATPETTTPTPAKGARPIGTDDAVPF